MTAIVAFEVHYGLKSIFPVAVRNLSLAQLWGIHLLAVAPATGTDLL